MRAHAHTHTRTYTRTSISIYIYIYIYLSVYLSLSICTISLHRAGSRCVWEFRIHLLLFHFLLIRPRECWFWPRAVHIQPGRASCPCTIAVVYHPDLHGILLSDRLSYTLTLNLGFGFVCRPCHCWFRPCALHQQSGRAPRPSVIAVVYHPHMHGVMCLRILFTLTLNLSLSLSLSL